MIQAFKGDCLELLKAVPTGSVDMVFADPPYGITVAAWDSIVDIKAMFAELFRVVRPDGAVVVTANQPYSSRLVVENVDRYRCEWIWDKQNPTNFLNAKKQPMRQHEQVLVFSTEPTRYFPQMTEGKPNHSWKTQKAGSQIYNKQEERKPFEATNQKYPKTIQLFPKHASQSKLHPTQKPEELVRYFIRTYSMPGEVVLDPCLGSGTTLIAAREEGRDAFGFEKDDTFFETIQRRIA